MDVVKKLPGVTPHGRGFRYRKSIPKNLRPKIKKLATHPTWKEKYETWENETEFRVNLNARSIPEANDHQPHAVLEAKNFFKQAEADYDRLTDVDQNKPKSLPIIVARSLVREWFSNAKKREIEMFWNTYGEFDAERVQEVQYNVEFDLHMLEIDDHPDTQRYLERELQKILSVSNYDDVPTKDAGYKFLRKRLRKKLIEVGKYACKLFKNPEKTAMNLEHQEEAVEVPFRETKSAHALQNSHVVPERVIDALDRLWNERKKRYVKKVTYKKRKAEYERMKEFFGPKLFVHELDYNKCKEYAECLTYLPGNWTKKKDFKNLSIQQASDKARKINYPQTSFPTQDKYLDALKNFVREMEREGKVSIPSVNDINPIVAKVAADEARDPFTIQELQTIFHARLYTGCISDVRWFNKPGPNIIKRGRFWIPLIALWTGLRLNEICQLTVDDVRTTPKGRPFIFVHQNRQGMSLKTPNSKREVPVHPELIKCGFLHFVNSKREAGEELLFGEIPLGSTGYRSNDASRKFASFAISIGVKTPKNSEHSFRHCFRDFLDEAGVSERTAEALGGWSDSGERKTSRGYLRSIKGDGQKADRYYDDLCKLTYEGLDLSHLYAHADQMHVKLKT